MNLGETVLSVMLSDRFIPRNRHIIESWVQTEGKPLCSAYFRADSCRSKRCKYSHANSVAVMRNVHFCADDRVAKSGYEPCASKVEDISCIPRADFVKLMLLFVDGVCVYDYETTSTWQEWTRSFDTRGKLFESSGLVAATLPPISETDSPEDEVDNNVHEKSIDNDITLSDLKLADKEHPLSPTSIAGLLDLSNMAFARVFSFGSELDLCHIYGSCRLLRDAMLADELNNFRRKDYLSSINLTAGDLSKLKKQNKKKRLKAANSKIVSKKDGFRMDKITMR